MEYTLTLTVQGSEEGLRPSEMLLALAVLAQHFRIMKEDTKDEPLGMHTQGSLTRPVSRNVFAGWSVN